MSGLHTVIEVLASDMCCQETTGKRISRGVSVDDLVIWELGDSVCLGVLLSRVDVTLAC